MVVVLLSLNWYDDSGVVDDAFKLIGSSRRLPRIIIDDDGDTKCENDDTHKNGIG